MIRSDQIGSLVRPETLLDARDAFHAGRLTLEQLRAVENDAIDQALRMQRDVGIGIFTDGEMRRDAWQTNFSQAVEGFEADYPVREVRLTDGTAVKLEMHSKAVVGKLRATRRLTGVDAEFMKTHSPGPFKITMPGPTTVGRGGWREGTTNAAYGSLRELYADCASIVRGEMLALVADGASYIQLDEAFTNLAHESAVQAMRDRGEDPETTLADQIEFENVCYDAVRGQGVTLGAHLCRGSRSSAPKPALIDPNRQGRDFDWLAERLFDQLHADRFLFEWDTGFQALRFLPPGKVAVLGIVTSLYPELEPRDQLLRCVEAASKYCAVDQLALSTQCGFQGSGTRDGAHMSADQQRRKLELVVDAAHQIWPTSS
ncbi:MAG: cobalamin-independent methionine synthase II family protein [Chloroflexi bacterium]|nr:cobalamin-independent methionine synthase II family protein [Chloroflexota bacterium]